MKAEITKFAKLNKCKKLSFWVRPGWERVSKKWGWKKHIQMEKSIMGYNYEFFGGGGEESAAPPTSQTQFVREAPGIEERKIELMDIARVAQQP